MVNTKYVYDQDVSLVVTFACRLMPEGPVKGVGVEEGDGEGDDVGEGSGLGVSLGRSVTQFPSILNPTLPPPRQTPSLRTISAVEVAVIYSSVPSTVELVSTLTVTVFWVASTEYAVTVAPL